MKMDKKAKYTPAQNSAMRVAEPVATMASIDTSVAMTRQCFDIPRASSDDVRAKVINRIEADIQYHKNHPRALLTTSQMNSRALKLVSSLNK